MNEPALGTSTEEVSDRVRSALMSTLATQAALAAQVPPAPESGYVVQGSQGAITTIYATGTTSGGMAMSYGATIMHGNTVTACVSSVGSGQVSFVYDPFLSERNRQTADLNHELRYGFLPPLIPTK